MGPGALDMGDGFGPGRPIPREPGPELGPMGPGILAMEGLVPMFPEAWEKEAELAPKRPAALRMGARSRPWGPAILKLRPDPVPKRPPTLVSRLGPGPRPPALGLGPMPGARPLALGLVPRPGPGNIPDLGAGFVPTKPDLRLGFGPGPRPMGLGLGGPFPEVNRTPLMLGPDPGPMGPPLLANLQSSQAWELLPYTIPLSISHIEPCLFSKEMLMLFSHLC